MVRLLTFHRFHKSSLGPAKYSGLRSASQLAQVRHQQPGNIGDGIGLHDFEAV